MLKHLLVLVVLGVIWGAKSQRAPPGVNPQHYQPNQPQYQQQGQYQQVPQQQQYQPQVPVQQQIPQQQVPQQQYQQQQVPVQQYQQAPVQPQQVPVQQQPQGGHGHHHGGDRQVFNSGNIAHEREHIQEHMEVPIDTSKMTDQELQFHYFKMHDADNNNKLDGCELIKSLIHWHVEEDKNAGTHEKIGQHYDDKILSNMVDEFLQESDKNFDGFVDWIEYKGSSKKD
ncbi:unnamed protein product [Ceutorhynchus assimilis]|uniref:EF-hand domain-containing protein n=1 Tax=Ceutorhynchus assimilis TaxID=467358 RepID=A0A9P0GPN8_9CUCU|nr:unnamed protein product [Ceutorhynchus assimilis]